MSQVLLLEAFDPRQVSPEQGVGQLPVGVHKVVIEGAEVKPNKENTGGYLQLSLRIVEGAMSGTSGAFRLNLYAQSEVAKNIAKQHLSAICHATGQFQLGTQGNDPSVLFNKPFGVEVQLQAGQEKYTEVKRILNADGSDIKAGQQVQQQQVQQQSAPVQNAGFGQVAPQQDQSNGFQQQAPVQNTGFGAPAGNVAFNQQPAAQAAPFGQVQGNQQPSGFGQPQQQAPSGFGAPAQGGFQQQPVQQQPVVAGWAQSIAK